jgi:hypothetical protein
MKAVEHHKSPKTMWADASGCRKPRVGFDRLGREGIDAPVLGRLPVAGWVGVSALSQWTRL